MKVLSKITNPCDTKTDRCLNCHSHFLAVRPFIKEALVSKRFMKDLKDKNEVDLVVNAVLDCSSVDFFELHKFEESIDGNMIFRAKRDGVHLVYGVDKQMRLVFLRAFGNFSDYGKFLGDKREVRKLLAKV